MHEDTMEVGYSIKIKVFLIITAIVLFALGIWGIVDFYFKEKLYHIFLLGIPLIIFSLYTLIYVTKFRIRMNHSSIEKITFGSIRLFYDQIEAIRFYENKVVVMNNKSKIGLTRDVDKQERLVAEVISKIKDNANLKVLGNKKMKQIYFPD